MPMKSLVNAAYDVLTQKYANDGNQSIPMEFGRLLTEVGEELGIESQSELLKICSRFYTDLTLDGRFVIKENNTWVLREHEKFENVHIDMNEVYHEDMDVDEESKEANESDDEDNDEEERKPRNDDEEQELGEESDDDLNLGEDSEEEND